MVIGVFEDASAAQRAIAELRRSGFEEDEIGLLTRDEEGRTGVTTLDESKRSKAGSGAAIGAATGAGTGALWALGIAAGILPVIGPVIGGGLLAAVVASSAGGAAVGGLVGALVGAGFTREDAEFYERELSSGRTIVVVQSDMRAGQALAILRRHSGYDRYTATSSPGLGAY
jgi:hypothetical protein